MSIGKEPAPEAPPPTSRRWILHLDMDAFFAAVEVLDDPSLRGRPVIVGGTPEGRGVVSTASYEARRYGVHSAMPAARAVRLCPDGVFLRPRPRRYAEISRVVLRVCEEYTPLVEPLSIDEAFLDVTGSHPLRRPPQGAGPEAIARELRARVREETGGLEASVGVASNKFLAKVASDLAKPAGLLVVPEGRAVEFLAPLPVSRLWGVGPRTEARLRTLGLRRIGDLQAVPPGDLRRLLGGDAGLHLGRLCRGEDERPVVPGSEAKSVSQERTFAEFIPSDAGERIERLLFEMSDRVSRRLRSAGLSGRTVTLKVRDETFRTLTRSVRLDSATCLVEEIFGAARRLFAERVRLGGRRVRLLGVGVSQLTAAPARQLDLFGTEAWRRARRVADAADAVRRKLGDGAITRGRLVPPPARDEDRPRS